MNNPFEAVPLRPANVELRRDSRGMIHLRLSAPPRGLLGRIAGLIRYDYSRKVELDEAGTLYYGLVDGVNTLRDIAERMARELGRERGEVEPMVMLFTRKLMTTNMVELKVPAGAASGKKR